MDASNTSSKLQSGMVQSDLRGPSKAGWRTAAIVHELENQIQIQNENSYRFEQAKFHIIQELLGKLHATVALGEGAKKRRTRLPIG